MGIKDCLRSCCGCCYCFKGKYKVNDTPLQQLPKPKEADEVEGVPYIDREQEEILIIRRIDPCITENGTNHHTALYDLMHRSIEPQLVVRRGQPFKLELSLSRPYNEAKDGISFFFTVQDEDNAKYGQGTLVGLPLLKSPDRSLNWNVVLLSSEDTTLRVQVTPAADCVVAKWHLDVDTKIIDDGAYSYSYDTAIYILYNPWCPQDQVYLKSEEWREEALLNDVGLIWRGTVNRLRPCVWKYDQFEENVLDCSLYLIHKIGRVNGSERSDAVVTARALAAAVNSVDDNGAVMGNWSEDYSGGTHPTKWLGSKEILQQYYKKKKPVKYGQCWVFSGVLTTICRAVGLPARTITNYSSAHDTQSSLTVDFFLDQDGKIMDELNTDSVWNFHTWNEVWMQRPDLGREYGGWQAIDATPQEPSDDMYRVGPASVAAVKQGEVSKPYDNKFLYAEVNADKVYWRYTGPTQPLKLLNKDTHGTGKMILTKAPGRFDKEIITNTYKYPEKTEDERATMLRALRQSQSKFSRYYLNEEFNDIHFTFELKDDIKVGEPFSVILSMRNRGEKDHDVSIILRVDVTTYKGKVGNSVKKENYEVTVKAGDILDCKLPVTYDDYKNRLIDQGSFSVSCLATVKDTKYEYYAQDDFRVRKPDIVIDIQGKAIQGKENTAEIYVVNPLPVPLTKWEFTVEGPGLDKPLKLKGRGQVGPGEKAVATFTFRPLKVGRQTFAAKFIAKGLDDVDGFRIFMVEPLKEENGSAPA